MGTEPTYWDRRGEIELAREIIDKAKMELPLEDQYVEFKQVFFGENFKFVDIVCKEICGMLNAKEGGVILCGVNDDGEISDVYSDSYIQKQPNFLKAKTFPQRVDQLERIAKQCIEKRVVMVGVDNLDLFSKWVFLKSEDCPEGMVLRIHVKALPDSDKVAFFKLGLFIRIRESTKKYNTMPSFVSMLRLIKPPVIPVKPLIKSEDKEEPMKESFDRLELEIGKYLAAQDEVGMINDELNRMDKKRFTVTQKWKTNVRRSEYIMNLAKEQIIRIWEEEGFVEWLQKKHPRRYQEWMEMNKLRSLLFPQKNSPTGRIVAELEGDDGKSKYFGEVLNNEAHGFGRWEIGKKVYDVNYDPEKGDGVDAQWKVVGQFENGKVRGFVKVTCGEFVVDERVYDYGDYYFIGSINEGGKPDGYGNEVNSMVETWSYSGNYKNGVPQGYGVSYEAINHTSFDGEWDNGNLIKGNLYVDKFRREFSVDSTKMKWGEDFYKHIEDQLSDKEKSVGIGGWKMSGEGFMEELLDAIEWQSNGARNWSLTSILEEDKSEVLKKIFGLD